MASSKGANRRHAHKKKAARGGPDHISLGTCPDCGKQCYKSREQARRAARVIFPGRQTREYPCGEWWHVTTQSAARTTAWKDYRLQQEQEGKAS